MPPNAQVEGIYQIECQQTTSSDQIKEVNTTNRDKLQLATGGTDGVSTDGNTKRILR